MRRTTVPAAVGENRRRIQILEAVPPPPVMAVLVYRTSTPQSIPDNTTTKIQFDQVIYEYGADWVDLGVSTTNVILPVRGVYAAQAQIRWDTGVGPPVGGRRFVSINATGGSISVGDIASYDAPRIDVAIDIDMCVNFVGVRDEGEVLSIVVLQDSTGSLDVISFGLSVALVSAF